MEIFIGISMLLMGYMLGQIHLIDRFDRTGKIR